MKKAWIYIGLLIFAIHASAMSDTAQAVTATTAAGLINAGTAIYLQGQGMNPQFVMLPNGVPTVVPASSIQSSGLQKAPSDKYSDQNNQSQKQAFFNDN